MRYSRLASGPGWLRRLVVVICTLLPGPAHAVAPAPTLVGVESNGILRVIDPVSLYTSALYDLSADPRGLFGDAMAADGSELLFMSALSTTLEWSLARFDPASPQTQVDIAIDASPLAAWVPPGVTATRVGMATDGGGSLFVLVSRTEFNSTTQQHEPIADIVVEANLATGITLVLGSTGVTDLQSIAVLADGRLCAWSSSGLMAIDRVSGVATSLGSSGPGDGTQGLAATSSGQLFGAQISLQKFDPETGAETPLDLLTENPPWSGGPFGPDLRSLAEVQLPLLWTQLGIRTGLCPPPYDVSAQVPNRIEMIVGGTETLDVHEILQSELRMAGQPFTPLAIRIEDLTRPPNTGNRGDCLLPGSDGIDDLVLEFNLEQVRDRFVYFPGRTVLQLEVSARTLDGSWAGAVQFENEFTQWAVAPTAAPAAALALDARAWPNPFNPHTMLACRLDRPTRLRLTIYDERGRALKSLFDGDAPAGEFSRAWDGTDDEGRPVASGVYFARFATASAEVVTRLALVR